MTETERMYAYFICSIPMIGGVRAGQLLSRFGDPQGVYEAGTAGWREILSDSVVEYMDRQKKSGNLEEEYHSLGETDRTGITGGRGISTETAGNTGPTLRLVL